MCLFNKHSDKGSKHRELLLAETVHLLPGKRPGLEHRRLEHVDAELCCWLKVGLCSLEDVDVGLGARDGRDCIRDEVDRRRHGDGACGHVLC